MRKLIAAMKITLDGKMDGPRSADWVEAWSDDYGLTPQIDACLLGGGMYPGYEYYWTSIQNEPEKPIRVNAAAPTPAEREWAHFIARTPHYVLSNTLNSATWAATTFLRAAEEIAALKRQSGKDIYLIGGARTTASLIDAGFVDELRLLVYPLIAGEGKALFAASERRRKLQLREAQPLSDGRLSLIYALG